MRRSKDNKTSGFTLIELLVVVLILGILIALALPQYLSSVRASKTNTANANSKAIATAVQTQYVQAGGGSYAAFTAAALPGLITGDMGGSIPTNPCTGTSDFGASASGAAYWVTTDATGFQVQPNPSTTCNTTQITTLGTP